ncbi:MAG TPA: hypothetical protein VK176_10880 [Phycisphaerales bacterium]|nr:hypothetical protein [Phycisphaerales bacterium]
MATALIEAPASTSSQRIEVLAALDAYDAILNDDYAFIAYKETDVATGEWRVRIKARHLTGVVFEPEAMRLNARSAGAHGKPFFSWGNTMDPSAGDPRSVQYRVHVKEGKPAEIEIFVQLRKADGSADAPRSARFAWPG